MDSKKEIYFLYSVLVIFMYMKSISTINIDCSGKPFHCINSTHFMICVDLGAGVSKTVDNNVIQCPLPTVCRKSNNFECEYQLPTTTVPRIPVGDETNEFEINTQVTKVSPFLETNLNTLSDTTQAEFIISTHTEQPSKIFERIGKNKTSLTNELHLFNLTTTEPHEVESLVTNFSKANRDDSLGLLKIPKEEELFQESTISPTSIQSGHFFSKSLLVDKILSDITTNISRNKEIKNNEDINKDNSDFTDTLLLASTTQSISKNSSEHVVSSYILNTTPAILTSSYLITTPDDLILIDPSFKSITEDTKTTPGEGSKDDQGLSTNKILSNRVPEISTTNYDSKIQNSVAITETYMTETNIQEIKTVRSTSTDNKTEINSFPSLDVNIQKETLTQDILTLNPNLTRNTFIAITEHSINTSFKLPKNKKTFQENITSPTSTQSAEVVSNILLNDITTHISRNKVINDSGIINRNNSDFATFTNILMLDTTTQSIGENYSEHVSSSDIVNITTAILTSSYFTTATDSLIKIDTPFELNTEAPKTKSDENVINKQLHLQDLSINETLSKGIDEIINTNYDSTLSSTEATKTTIDENIISAQLMSQDIPSNTYESIDEITATDYDTTIKNWTVKSVLYMTEANIQETKTEQGRSTDNETEINSFTLLNVNTQKETLSQDILTLKPDLKVNKILAIPENSSNTTLRLSKERKILQDRTTSSTSTQSTQVISKLLLNEKSLSNNTTDISRSEVIKNSGTLHKNNSAFETLKNISMLDTITESIGKTSPKYIVSSDVENTTPATLISSYLITTTDGFIKIDRPFKLTTEDTKTTSDENVTHLQSQDLSINETLSKGIDEIVNSNYNSKISNWTATSKLYIEEADIQETKTERDISTDNSTEINASIHFDDGTQKNTFPQEFVTLKPDLIINTLVAESEPSRYNFSRLDLTNETKNSLNISINDIDDFALELESVSELPTTRDTSIESTPTTMTLGTNSQNIEKYEVRNITPKVNVISNTTANKIISPARNIEPSGMIDVDSKHVVYYDNVSTMPAADLFTIGTTTKYTETTKTPSNSIMKNTVLLPQDFTTKFITPEKNYQTAETDYYPDRNSRTERLSLNTSLIRNKMQTKASEVDLSKKIKMEMERSGNAKEINTPFLQDQNIFYRALLNVTVKPDKSINNTSGTTVYPINVLGPEIESIQNAIFLKQARENNSALNDDLTLTQMFSSIHKSTELPPNISGTLKLNISHISVNQTSEIGSNLSNNVTDTTESSKLAHFITPPADISNTFEEKQAHLTTEITTTYDNYLQNVSYNTNNSSKDYLVTLMTRSSYVVETTTQTKINEPVTLPENTEDALIKEALVSTTIKNGDSNNLFHQVKVQIKAKVKEPNVVSVTPFKLLTHTTKKTNIQSLGSVSSQNEIIKRISNKVGNDSSIKSDISNTVQRPTTLSFQEFSAKASLASLDVVNTVKGNKVITIDNFTTKPYIFNNVTETPSKNTTGIDQLNDTIMPTRNTDFKQQIVVENLTIVKSTQKPGMFIPHTKSYISESHTYETTYYDTALIEKNIKVENKAFDVTRLEPLKNVFTELLTTKTTPTLGDIIKLNSQYSSEGQNITRMIIPRELKAFSNINSYSSNQTSNSSKNEAFEIGKKHQPQPLSETLYDNSTTSTLHKENRMSSGNFNETKSQFLEISQLKSAHATKINLFENVGTHKIIIPKSSSNTSLQVLNTTKSHTEYINLFDRSTPQVTEREKSLEQSPLKNETLNIDQQIIISKTDLNKSNITAEKPSNIQESVRTVVSNYSVPLFKFAYTNVTLSNYMVENTDAAKVHNDNDDFMARQKLGLKESYNRNITIDKITLKLLNNNSYQESSFKKPPIPLISSQVSNRQAKGEHLKNLNEKLFVIPSKPTILNNSKREESFYKRTTPVLPNIVKTLSVSRLHSSTNVGIVAGRHYNSTFNCMNRFRGRYADNNNCRRFYICIGKIQHLVRECPVHTVFSEIKKQCTKNLSHCMINNQFHCIQEGRFCDVLNRNVYYICVKNKDSYLRFKFQCQGGYYLNKTSVTCVQDKFTQKSSISIDSDSNKASDQSTQELKPKEKKEIKNDAEKNVCKHEGKFADPDDCRRYYVCSKKSKSVFRRRTKKCDSDEVFHREKKKCVSDESYECK